MWSALHRVGQLLGLVSIDPPVDLDDIAAILDAEDNVNEDEQNVDSTINENNSDGVLCQHRVGIVDALFDNHGFIKSKGSDDSSRLHFQRKHGPENLKVGDQVVYLAYRVSEDSPWVVRKILYVENEFWSKTEDLKEDTNFDQTVIREQCETAYKHVIAKVTGRRGRTVLAGQLQFCLDSVHIDFIPVEGDWLMLHSLVQTEQLADTLLVVDKVMPVRSQQLEGRVSHWSPETQQGIIAGEVVFSKDVCVAGFLPRVNDEVRVACIESEQGQLTWRAVLVVPTSERQLQSCYDSQALTTLLEDKQGILITNDTNCGVLNIGQEKEIRIEVKNDSDSVHTLQAVELAALDSQFQLVQPLVDNPIQVPTQKSLHFVFKVKARFVGRSTELVVFKFEGFEIGRHLPLDVQSASLAVSLAQSRDQTIRRSKQPPITAEKLLATRNGFVPGVRPLKPASFVPVNLGMFVVPEKLLNIVLGSQYSTRTDDVIARLRDSYCFLSEPLSAHNYVLRWDTLIHLEELENVVNISRYNTHASLRRVQDCLSLEIPGLAERRPSLIVGDRVIAREAWTDENSWKSDDHSVSYEGFIHKVLSNEVLLKFSPNFHDSCSGMYSMSFEANRTSFRREHQAIHVAFRNLSPDWIFPSKVNYKPPQIIITEEVGNATILTKNQNVAVNNTQQDKTIIGKHNFEVDDSESSNLIIGRGIQNDKTINDALNKAIDLEDKLNIICELDEVRNCDKVIESDKLFVNTSIVQKQKTEISIDSKNCDKHLSSDDLIIVENSIEEILNTATHMLNSEEKSRVNQCNASANNSNKKHVKSKVSDMFEKLAAKEETHKKMSSPRVSVATFLQNSNSAAEKSPKEVKNVLQQLASMSPKESVPANNYGMKTLEEIEKSLLNGSNDSSILDGIKPLPEKEASQALKEAEQSPLEKFLNLNNSITKQTENSNQAEVFGEKDKNLFNVSESSKKILDGKTEKVVKNHVNESEKASSNNQNKVKWNSNSEMKLGNVKESKNRIGNRKKRMVKWFNPLLNHYQKEAVRNILRGEARPLPYVIFGPPGTGKTITLVEAILQIYFLIPESRLLIGTPSNSSADLVCERLLDSELLAPGDLLRLVGFHYMDQGRIPDKLRLYCGISDIKAREDQDDPAPAKEGVVNISRHAIGRHRITVGTCNTLGVLYQLGFPRGHFTHVLLDEAGQATEPEILIPLAFLHSSYGQAVLAGDPLQLGPVVLSKVAEHFGLGESLLCRLLQHTPYSRDPLGYPTTGGYNPRLLTRLLYNYRSLPEILSLPNQMFYDEDLIPQISETSSEEAIMLARLKAVLPPRESGPPAVVFHGVRGTNCHAPDSPSWHNPHEAVQATMYLQALYSYGLTPDQCGIITPYQAQVLKIRQMLETLEVPLPKVGSVEEFQGQERMAVILSTVRSSPRLIETDLRHTVGFVASPRRLNVAISRARALLIIVGNPHLLSKDQYWRTVLEYCVSRGAYTGCDLPPLDAKQ